MDVTRAELINIATRAAWTFVQTLVGVLLAISVAWNPGDAFDKEALYAGIAASIAAALSVIKSWMATRVSDSQWYTDTGQQLTEVVAHNEQLATNYRAQADHFATHNAIVFALLDETIGDGDPADRSDVAVVEGEAVEGDVVEVPGA